MRRFVVALALGVVLGMAGDVIPMNAQEQPALVIRGGTLIDGNGGAPVQNAVVVIQSNRIIAVGQAGEVDIPNGAREVDATGKWILPGLMDPKTNWYWQYGEGALHYGMTSGFVSGGRNDYGIAVRDATAHGIIPGPRLFQTYVALNGRGPDGSVPDRYRPGDGSVYVGTPEEAVRWVQRAITAGADFITFGNGDGPVDVWRAGIEEAERQGKAVVFRAMGPQTRGREVCQMGDGIIYVHTGNAGAQIAADESKWADYIGLPPDAYSDMDDAKADALIQQFIGCNAYLEPDLMAADRGFHKNWDRVQQENRDFLDDDNLRAYYPMHAYAAVIENSKSPQDYLTPEVYEMRTRGFANHLAFLKRYVDAGGKLVPASDNPQTHPGLGLQQEITAFVEDVGLTPMQAIQSATLWTAEGYKVDDELGTIEAGKLADIIIVGADPLQDIKNLRQVDTVILDGNIVDHSYHASYPGNIFADSELSDEWAVVANRGWAAALKQATWRPNTTNGRYNLAGGITSEKAPTPGVEAIYPYIVIRGSNDTDMTITGFNFIDRTEVWVDGRRVPTEVISRTELHITIPENLLARGGKLPIAVKNPPPLSDPIWGDTANMAYLLVPFEFTTTSSNNQW